MYLTSALNWNLSGISSTSPQPRKFCIKPPRLLTIWIFFETEKSQSIGYESLKFTRSIMQIPPPSHTHFLNCVLTTCIIDNFNQRWMYSEDDPLFHLQELSFTKWQMIPWSTTRRKPRSLHSNSNGKPCFGVIISAHSLA